MEAILTETAIRRANDPVWATDAGLFAVERPRREEWSAAGWGLVVGTASFLVTGAVSLLLFWALGHQRVPSLERSLQQNPAGFLFLAAVVAPLLETVFGQWIPVWLCGLFVGKGRSSVVPKVVVASIVFGALHLANSPVTALLAMLVMGPIFAYTFVRWRERSRAKAYVATVLTHGVHNLWAAGLAVIFA